MKRIIVIALLVANWCDAQTSPNATKSSGLGPLPAPSAVSPDITTDRANNKRISFIVGVGPSIASRSLYLDPVIDPINNFVHFQKASRLKGSISLGIAYTPYTTDILSTPTSVNAAGQIVTTQSVETVQKGITGALFVNPLLFSKISENQSYFDSPDFGFGLGYRFAGGVSIFATSEFFWVRQPRDWFADQFKANNAAYMVGGEVQKSIDLKDNNLFATKPTVTFGFKVCYTFDIVKRFITTTTTKLTPSVAGPGLLGSGSSTTTTTTNQ